MPSWKTFLITLKGTYASNSGHTDKKLMVPGGNHWGKVWERSQEQTDNYCNNFYKLKEAKLLEKLFMQPIENS